MNENAKKWCEAIKSKEYEQNRGRLRRDDKYCCLGVACDLYHKATGLGVWNKIHSTDGCFHSYFSFKILDSKCGDYTTYLPDEVREWLGLDSNDGRHGSTSLANLNDAGFDFEYIASTIESQPAGLFKE